MTNYFTYNINQIIYKNTLVKPQIFDNIYRSNKISSTEIRTWIPQKKRISLGTDSLASIPNEILDKYMIYPLININLTIVATLRP